MSWTTEAANLVADGDIQGAIDELEKVLKRVDGDLECSGEESGTGSVFGVEASVRTF